MEVAGLIVNLLVAVGTLSLAVFAFLEVRAASRVRQSAGLDRDAERLLGQDGGFFLRDLRAAVLRWRHNRVFGTAMERMLRRHEARIREFREEMREELKPALLKLKQDLVTAFPEIDDGGGLAMEPPDLADPNSWLSLKQFDELAGGAEVRLRENEWNPHNTIYQMPPGKRDEWWEEPAPESRMLKILRARYERLLSFEQLNRLPRQIPHQIDRDVVTVQQIHGDIRARLLEWKQRSSEAALVQVSVFVDALNPAGAADPDGDATEPDLDVLRLHLKGSIDGSVIGYFDVMANPSQLDNAQPIVKTEISKVISELKQRLGSAVEGLREETAGTDGPRLLELVERIESYGRRNLDNSKDEI